MTNREGKPGPFISLENVSLRLYGRVVFPHTDWEILDDQQWAVIGPNGSGKTTLMRALCGQVPAIGGRIAYHYARADGQARPQDRIAYVSFDDQRAALARWSPFYQARWNTGVREEVLSVRDYLSTVGTGRTLPGRSGSQALDPVAYAAHSREVVALLRIADLLERDVAQLSNGERSKVLIARALLRLPRLLILDNPFTGLDASFRERLRRVIARLMQPAPRDGVGLVGEVRVFVVTARDDEIPEGITHVLRVEGSQVVAQGPRETMLPALQVSAGGSRDSRSGLGFGETHAAGATVRAAPQGSPDRGLASRSGDADGPGAVLVDMRGVHVSYDGVQVLRDVDWTVRKGEHWALLGPNGAGKTTLLSLILGDNLQAYANDIALFGRPRGTGESIWEIKQHIGWVSPELHVHYPRTASCLSVICSGFFDSVGLYCRPTDEQRAAARRWLRRLGMADVAQTPLRDLSQGEQRLVLVARALVKRPELLILDEPCQGLDATNRDRVLSAVDAAGAQLDSSVIYVTHNAGELPTIVTHLLRLDRGRIVEKGPLNGEGRDDNGRRQG